MTWVASRARNAREGRNAPPSVALVCALCAAAGVVVVTATFYPGMMNIDAILQLEEARRHVYYDWHPPIMARVWGVLDAVVPGPLGMLLLDNLMFWSGLALVVDLTGGPPLAAAAAIFAIGLWPPVFSALGVIWKDVAMGAALLLAFALMWRAELRSSRAALLLAIPLLLYAFALRHNAAPAVLPLALWAPFIWGTGTPAGAAARWRPLVAGVALFALLGGGAVTLDRLLANGGRLYPTQQIFLHDLTAISVKSGQVYLPASLRTENGPPTVEGLACLYTPEDVGAVLSANFGACPLRIDKIVDPGRMADLEAQWMRAVLAHPALYAQHRWSVFREQLAIGRDRVCYPLHDGIEPNRLGIEFTPTRLYRPALRVLSAAAYRTPLFRGWIYLLVAGALFLAAGRGDDRSALRVVTASGLLYGLTYLVVSPGCAFRFNWWSIVAALTGLAVFAGPARPRR